MIHFDYSSCIIHYSSSCIIHSGIIHYALCIIHYALFTLCPVRIYTLKRPKRNIAHNLVRAAA